MDLIAYIHVLKRRWFLVALPVIGALAFAFVTLPEDTTPDAGTLVSEYTATATLIATPSFSGELSENVNMQTVALFAGLGEVPQRAAEILGYGDEPQILASTVVIAAVPDVGTLTITTTDQNPQAAADRVNAFAKATTAYFRDKDAAEAAARIETLTRQLDTTTRQLQAAKRRSQADPDNPVLEARVTAYQAQYTATFGELSSLYQDVGSDGPLSTLQEGVAIPKVATGFVAPSSPVSRLTIAGLLGLLLGVALALFVERLDSRMRTREQVEDAYGLPVLADVPPRPWSWRRVHDIQSAERPASDTAEAHRALRSSVLLMHPEAAGANGQRRSLTLMVSSAQPGEGKTTTVANLATVMAEAGRSVLVLSLDLRSPRIHEFFEVANDTGIAELLSGAVTDLDDVARDTSVAGVRMITSGQRQEHPGALLAAIGPIVSAARGLADVVIIDTPPLLSVTDAVDIGQHVDAVLMVCRLNRTTHAQASAAFRTITRFGLPAMGLVLLESRPNASSESYRNGEARAALARHVGAPVGADATALVSPRTVDQDSTTTRPDTPRRPGAKK